MADELSPAYREHVKARPINTINAREELAKAANLLSQSDKADKAGEIKEIGENTFGQDVFNRSSATGETLLDEATVSLAKAWTHLIRADKETAADDVMEIGEEVFGKDAFHTKTNDAITNF